MDGDMQLDQAAVEYAAGKLHQVKKARGLPTLSAVFLRGNIFSENWADQLGGPFDCVHVGGSCAKERIHDLLRLVKEGVTVDKDKVQVGLARTYLRHKSTCDIIDQNVYTQDLSPVTFR